MLPIECVVRGYLAGLRVEGLPRDRRDVRARASRRACASPTLPEPIFTPATKAQDGHDENIDAEQAPSSSAPSVPREVERISLALYQLRGRARRERGIIIADTKFEFGLDDGQAARARRRGADARLVAVLAGRRVRARARQPSFDKQFVRDYCESLGWDKTPPGPELPDEVVAGTRARYVEAFERLTGIPFDRLPRRSRGRAAVRATVLVRPKQGILDPQGQAVESSLRQLGFAVAEARVGRVVDLEVEATPIRGRPARRSSGCASSSSRTR